ncbi:hypothetical protein [Desulfatibacillum aliphaticivorans]|uniref:Uncharacterized protein n=2 Tax=Desulfatibacillum aliphaticivorans TaxID=218208 RepID=B8FJ00_DESAL|nr:hypothetical protein [Desulfatibacillum aliphaticivorans]ACL04391.1 hypothetical protein Dalk_2699 [Desulfatibacillum aliphaticivorans]
MGKKVTSRERKLRNSLKSDPYGGMKIDLAKTVITGPDPSLSKLENAFMEEFGEPPPPQIVRAFVKYLPPDKKPLPPLQPLHTNINLIKEQARVFLEEQSNKQLEESGGRFLTLGFEKDTLELLPKLQSIYGLNSNEELIAMALKILEQQARGIAPEIFSTDDAS